MLLQMKAARNSRFVGKENESNLVNPVSYPDVFSYHWIGMGAQKLSTYFLE